MNKIVLIVAGGTGTRMRTVMPKQFLLVNDRPILMYTINVFHRYDPDMGVILVLPENQIGTWKSLCESYQFKIRHEIKIGGETRFHSVKKNLGDIPDNTLVAIHDGVRPLVSLDTIDRCFGAANEHGNAIPCIDIPETMRIIEHEDTRQVERSKYRLIQTPQVFEAGILKKAYLQAYQKQFTDDAGVVEKAGHVIYLVKGNPENIKITFEKDLIVAAALLKQVNQ